jgi:hypothetical protein
MCVIVNLLEVKRIAEEVAHAEDPALEVLGAMMASRGSAYTELTMISHDSRTEPCHFVIGADRSGGELALRQAIASRLREHLHRR